MDIREDYARYMDAQGYISNIKNPPLYSCDNLIRFTSEYYIALKQNGVLTDADISKFNELMSTDEVLPGLFRRTRVSTGYEAHDDYTLLVAASAYIDPDASIAKRVLAYGKSNRWDYNNLNPGKFRFPSWLMRMPNLIAHFYFCASELPPLWMRFYWALIIILTQVFDPDNKHDSWALSYALILIAGEHDPLTRYAKGIWLKRLHLEFPGGIAQVMGAYFQNPDHPSAHWYGLDTAQQ